MKKIVSLVLMVILLLSSLSFTSEAMTAGEKLVDLGLVKGDNQGNLLEGETLSRAQMMVLLSRLNGVEESAENFDSEMLFRDVPVDSYYAPFIAYAYEKNWTKGTGEETFSPDAIVNRQMVATFMLRVLGYDVSWDEAIEKASQLGIVDDVSNETFTRKNAFDMIYDAVNTKVADDDILLGEKLGVGEDLSLITGKALSNTVVELTFSSPIDAETVDVSNIAITDLYNESDDLNLIDLEVNDTILRLTTEAMDNLVYAVEVTDLTDIYGNPLDLENSSLTFAGRGLTDEIDEINIKRIDDTIIAVEFNESIDESAADENLYNIDSNLGKPDKVEQATALDQETYTAVEDYKKTVLLTIPETKAGQVYTLTVMKGLLNIDGVETSEALTENFIGAGITTKLPRIEEVVALDAQTLKIYFDRDIMDETIEGRLWVREEHKLLGSNILSVDATGNKVVNETEDFDLEDAAYVYESKEDNNVLVLRMNQPVFESERATGPEGIFHLIANSEYVYSEDNTNIITFEANDEQVTNPTLEGVMMLNEETIEVYFNAPVQIPNKDAIKIYKESGNLTDNKLITTIKNMTSKNGYTWTMALEDPIKPSDVSSNMAYFHLPDGAAKDMTGTVDVLESSTSKNYQSLAFAMNYNEATPIQEFFVVMPDNRTIEVIYPEGMKPSDVINEENYLLLVGDSTDEISELTTVSFEEGYSIYDEDKYTSTLFLDAPIKSGSDMSDYYLAIDSQVKNVLETKTIKEEATNYLEGLPSEKGLILQFAPDTEKPKRPILENVKVTDDRYSLTLQFNEDIAFVKANNAFHASRDLTNGLTTNEFLEALEIKVQFEGEGEALSVQSNDISSLSGIGPSHEDSVKVTFNQKLAVESIGSVTTKDKKDNQIYNRKSAFAAVNSPASKVNFGVDASLYSDGKPPKLLPRESYGIDRDEDGQLDQVTLVYDETMKLTEPIDTNAKAKTLITDLTVDNGVESIDLSDTITDVTVKDNQVIINLDDSIMGTGEVKISIDADTGNLNGQLQDTSILKAPDEEKMTLVDTAAPVLIKATGTVGSEAVRLTFSERVSGGTADVPENIQVSDLNWTDVSGDGASFIKFILSSKNKANHGIVIDQDVILNDLGKDTVGVIEDSIFDSSGNPVPKGIQVILDNQ